MNPGRTRAWLLATALALAPIGGAARAAGVDAEAEVATALYAASATQAAAEKAADAKIAAERTQIADLTVRVRAGEVKRAELVAAQEGFVAELAAKDRAYGQAIAVFRGAVTDICATPAGVAAMARFNAGDEAGALAILDTLRAANDRARRKREDIESATEGRHIAELALEARARGKQTTGQVIARYEEVVRLDPDVAHDWIDLGRLYRDAGRLAEARGAAQSADRTASSEREHALALNDLGDVLLAQSDVAGARKAFEAALALVERLSADHPGSGDLSRDVAVSLVKVGDAARITGDYAAARADFARSLAISRRLAVANPGNVLVEQDVILRLQRLGDMLDAAGDRAGERALYQEGLAIARRLAAADPGDPARQRDVAVALDRVGTASLNASDLPGARVAYQEELDICRRLASADPGNARFQIYLAMALWRLAGGSDTHVRWADVVAQMETMRQKGMLSPDQEPLLAEALRRGAAEEGK